MRHGSMFTGIAGFELGFMLAGYDVETVWQSEIDPWCLQLLERRFPDAVQLGDVTTVERFPDVDVLTAGFPCQPVSQAGRGAAQDDERWLWPEVHRAIVQTKPTVAILENVRGLRSRGLQIVLADLRDAGYDCQWDLIPAAAVGAPHLRHRFAIIAYPQGTHMGSIFDRRPPVFTWADEQPAKPRLIKSVKHRKQRLSALGNAVVPQWVAYLALAINRARSSGSVVPETLFGHTVESFDGTLPYAGVMLDRMVHESTSCAPRLDGKRLWPTAAAHDAEWGIDALRATVHVDGTPARDPHMRLYHPDTNQIVQRTLHNYVLGEEYALWPTPQHADGNGKGASAERGAVAPGEWRSVNLVDAVVEHEKIWQTPLASDAAGSRGSKGAARPDEGGLAHEVRKHEKLWPTATVSDGIGSRRATAARDDWTSNAGTTLTDAAWIEEGVDPHTVEGQRADGTLLWPTAAASDHKGVSQPGQRRGQLEEAVKTDEEFWPTPNASDAAGGRTTAGAREGGPPLAAAVHEVVTDDPGKTLNPRWVEWLMGYPADWTVLEPAQQEQAA